MIIAWRQDQLICVLIRVIKVLVALIEVGIIKQLIIFSINEILTDIQTQFLAFNNREVNRWGASRIDCRGGVGCSDKT